MLEITEHEKTEIRKLATRLLLEGHLDEGSTVTIPATLESGVLGEFRIVISFVKNDKLAR